MESEEWRHLVSGDVKEAEGKGVSLAKEKRRRRKEDQQLASVFVCPICSRDCHARIGLMSHYRKCASLHHQRARSSPSSFLMEGCLLLYILA